LWSQVSVLALVLVVALVSLSLSPWKKKKKKATEVGKVTSLIIYPLKSGAGMEVKASGVSGLGLEFDRQWMVVDFRGAFVSQRRAPKLALVKAVPKDGGLLVSAPRTSDVFVKEEGATLAVRCWDDVMEATEVPEGSKWFETYLEMKGCKLVTHKGDRYVDRRYAPRDAKTKFSDGFPFLLASEKSLGDLNRRMKEALPMDRFRPNIVVDGPSLEAWAEDSWKTIVVGSQTFLVAKPCSRCKMPTIDQASGIPAGEGSNSKLRDDDEGGLGPDDGVEPTTTLRTFRTGKHLGFLDKKHWADDVFFGQNLCHLGTGEKKKKITREEIKVGDTLWTLS